MWVFSEALVKDFENSRCSPGPGGASLGGTCLDGGQSAPLNGENIKPLYYVGDKTKGLSRLSRYGQTCKPFPAESGGDLLMWCQEGSRAKTSARRGGALELTATGRLCGAKWPELSARFDLDTHSWKTAHCLFPEDLPWSSVILPRSGTMRSGVVYQRENSVPITSEIGSGFSRDQMMPTPTCHNAKEGAYPAEYTRKTPTLATHVGGKIHPEFQEWMMGWPQGWTGLSQVEMGRFQLWQQSHLNILSVALKGLDEVMP